MLPRLPKGWIEQQLYDQAVERLESAEAARNSKAGGKLPQHLRRAAFKLAAIFRREHGVVDRDMAELVGRTVLSGITPRKKAGARLSDRTIKAAALLQGGQDWQQVYPQVFPGYDKMPDYRKRVHEKILRRNVHRLWASQGIKSPIRRGRPKKPSE